MAQKLGYDGTPEFKRDRSLSETSIPEVQQQNLAREDDVIDRELETEKLFDDLSKSYIKGEVLKRGLSKMEPAQYIPIDQTAEPIVAAAKRQYLDQSKNGTVITYSMYQNCIDTIIDNRWEFRKNYLDIQPVNSSFSSRDFTESKRGTGLEEETKSLIREFLAENGIAGTIMAVLVASPFQSIIFQSLSPEEGAAKAAHLTFALSGIAFLIELGIKAERIYQFLKNQKLNVSLTEDQVLALEDPEVRAAALSDIGIDQKEFKQDLKIPDCELIVDYVTDYYQLHGGMLEDNSNFTLDHWLAYKQVAYNQQNLRGALNTADKYTDKYRELRNETLDPIITGPVSASATSSNTEIQIDLASTLRQLNGRTETLYDDIVRSFNHYITDGDLCCLVALFGSQSPELLRTISTILRILAVDLGGEFIRLDNILRRWIANKLQAAAFEILEQLNSFYHKIDAKLTEAFTINIDGLPYCSALLSVGLALLQSLDIIYDQIRYWIRDIQSAISDFGAIRPGSWEIAAERTHLVGIAKVLEVMARRLEIAEYCNTPDGEIVTTEPKETNSIAEDAADQVISQILEKPRPVLGLSKQELNKYFPNVGRRTSKLLKFSYGPGTQLEPGQEEPAPQDCQQALNLDQISTITSELSKKIKEVFND